MNRTSNYITSLVLNSEKADYVVSANNHSDVKFYNIDFRTLLGDSFELGAKYNIILNTNISYKNSGTMDNNDYRNWRTFESDAMDFKQYSFYGNSGFTKSNKWMWHCSYASVDRVHILTSQCTFTLTKPMGYIYLSSYFPDRNSTSTAGGTYYRNTGCYDIYKCLPNNNKLVIYKTLMLNRQIASLRLSMNDISTSDTLANYPLENSIGSMDTYRTTIVFKNLDMRAILGDMYDRYEYFNICMPIMFNGGSTFGTANVDKLVRFNVSGLPWVNNTYDVQSRSLTNSCVLGFQKLSTSISLVQYNYANIATFRRCENINFTITITRYNGDACATTALYPRSDFYFKIYPCDTQC